MTIWIAGSRGMLGSELSSELSKAGRRVLGTDRSEVDITDLQSIRHYIAENQPSVIINCAAYTKVDRAETEAISAQAINCTGAQNLAKAAAEWGSHLIHYSTDYVFNGQSSSPYVEEDTCDPISSYGRSKRDGECAVLRELPSATIVRLSGLFGLNGHNFVLAMLRLMRERDCLRIVHDQVFRPSYCSDVVMATLALLDKPGIFHFANAEETSWYQYAGEILRLAKESGHKVVTTTIEPITSEEYGLPAPRPGYSVLSTDKFEFVTGLTPRPWQEALQDYLSKCSSQTPV